MPQRDPDQPPPDAVPLSEALRRFLDPDFAAAFDRLPEREKQLTLLRVGDRYANDGIARLQAGNWIAWGREGTPTGPWRRLPPEAWSVFAYPLDRLGQPRRDAIWLGCVRVQGSDLHYYGIVVWRATTQPRRPSIAAVRSALAAADAETGRPLTTRDAENIAVGMGATRDQGREALRHLRERKK